MSPLGVLIQEELDRLAIEQPHLEWFARFETALEWPLQPRSDDESRSIITHLDAGIRQRRIQRDGGQEAHAPSAVDLHQLASRCRQSARQHTGGAEGYVLESVDPLEADQRRRSLATRPVPLPPQRDIAR